MPDSPLTLYSYWRSSASYRVRIGLNLKQLDYKIVPVHLLDGGGQQHSDTHHHRNPQEMVPVLQHGQRMLRQSMALLEYIDEVWPDQGERLLPDSSRDRHYVRMIAQMIACDVSPLANLRVLQVLEGEFHVSEEQRQAWSRHWVTLGLLAVEETIARNPIAGRFCFGDMPTLADCVLVPQMYNARRLGIDFEQFPRLRIINATCLDLPAFAHAQPEKQVDAPVKTD